MKIVRYIVAFVLTAALAVGIVLLCRLSAKDRALLTCEKLEVLFSDSLKFVSEQDVRSYLAAQYGSFIGQRIDSVRLYSIEEMLLKKSAILDAQAWITDDGVLSVLISQRAPALRFAYEGGGGFYIDDGGFIFPLHNSYTAPVRVIEGYIPVNVRSGFKGYAAGAADKKWLGDMLMLNSYLRDSRKWNSDIYKLRIDKDENLVLNSIRGRENFIFGNADRMEEKFTHIDQYYNYIAPKVDTAYYKSINLKYKQQIICSRDI